MDKILGLGRYRLYRARDSSNQSHLSSTSLPDWYLVTLFAAPLDCDLFRSVLEEDPSSFLKHGPRLASPRPPTPIAPSGVPLRYWRKAPRHKGGRIGFRWSDGSRSWMVLPCKGSFGPSRLRWSRRIGTTASADFCSHGLSYPSPPRLSGKPYSRVRLQISPDKNVLCLCPSATST